eukprot:Gb_10220 [translate_table: standard]
MGGDPVATKPSILRVDEEVRGILDRSGLLSFFHKFISFSEDISLQVVESWNDGKVYVNGLDFIILDQLIAKVSGLPREGEAITREKTNQVGQLTKFIKDDKTFCWLNFGIVRESLLKPWDRVSKVILTPKVVDKAKVLDFVESLEKDHNDSDVGKNTEGGCSFKEVGTSPLDKVLAKDPDGTQNLVEELKCHLKVLNGMGGFLSSTCAFINLLTLEITNYMKAVM